MDELKTLLENVPRSYQAFVDVMMRKAKKNKENTQKLTDYIKSHPEARSDDIIEFSIDNLQM